MACEARTMAKEDFVKTTGTLWTENNPSSHGRKTCDAVVLPVHELSINKLLPNKAHL